MNKMTVTAALVGASALTVNVWAQNPGRPPEDGQPNPEHMRAEMRERMMQQMQQRGGPMMQQMMQRGPMMQGMASRGQIPHGPMKPGREGEHGASHGELLKRILENPEIAKKAGVTDEQVKKLKDGQFNFDKQMITMRADAEVAKMDVKRLMESGKVDRSAVEKALDAAGAKELAVRKLEMMRMLDVKETLGEESIEKIKNMVREHVAKRVQMAQGPGMPGAERPMMNPPRGGDRPQRDGDRPQSPREGGREQKRDN